MLQPVCVINESGVYAMELQASLEDQFKMVTYLKENNEGSITTKSSKQVLKATMKKNSSSIPGKRGDDILLVEGYALHWATCQESVLGD